MPVFEYTCKNCGHEFEEFVHSAEEPSAPCPSCGKKGAVRKLSVFAARDHALAPAAEPGGGCGRCGDPSGPCSI